MHTSVRSFPVAALVVGLLASPGCASSGTSRGTSGSSNALTAEQLMETGEDNLLDAIRRLRPQWLRVRGPSRSPALGPVEVAVFVDDVRSGGASALSRIQIESVASVEFISATDATTRYGLNVAGGVISVRRR